MTAIRRIATPLRIRAALTALSLVGIFALPYVIWRNWAANVGGEVGAVGGGIPSFWGFDAHAYWAADPSNLYAEAFGNTSGLDAFRYTPPLGQLFSFFGALPWEVFFGLYFLAMAGILLWIGGRWTLALVGLPPVTLELFHGNIHLFMALAIYLGFRFPAAWAFVILAKITPGVGALWFVFRGEWRAVAQIAVATGGIAIVSWLIAPDLWPQYIAAMRDNLAVRPPSGYPFDVPQAIRLPIAAAVVWWGARTDRRWTVPVAATIGLPLIWWHGLTILLAAIPLIREDRRRDEGDGLALDASPERATASISTASRTARGHG